VGPCKGAHLKQKAYQLFPKTQNRQTAKQLQKSWHKNSERLFVKDRYIYGTVMGFGSQQQKNNSRKMSRCNELKWNHMYWKSFRRTGITFKQYPLG